MIVFGSSGGLAPEVIRVQSCTGFSLGGPSLQYPRATCLYPLDPCSFSCLRQQGPEVSCTPAVRQALTSPICSPWFTLPPA